MHALNFEPKVFVKDQEMREMIIVILVLFFIVIGCMKRDWEICRIMSTYGIDGVCTDMPLTLDDSCENTFVSGLSDNRLHSQLSSFGSVLSSETWIKFLELLNEILVSVFFSSEPSSLPISRYPVLSATDYQLSRKRKYIVSLSIRGN